MTAGPRWTPEQLAQHRQALSRRLEALGISPESPPAALERPRTRAAAKHALPRAPRGMNKLEARYAQRLDLEKHAGAVLWWGFEAIKLRLADRTYYTPDFVVMPPGIWLEVHETKGFMRDDAAVKIKVAAEMFPIFHFYILRWHKGEWTRTRVPG